MRLTRLRLLAIALLVSFLAACAAPAPDVGALPSVTNVPFEIEDGAQRAYFVDFPAALLQAAVQSCVNPGQSVRQPDANR